MEFGMFHEFLSALSQTEAFAQIEAAENWAWMWCGWPRST
jgi:hypothetical protein